MPRAARGRTTRSTRSPATFALDGHLIETYNHIDDLPQLSSLPKKRPRHATRGATAAERRADRQVAATSDPIPNGIVTRSSRQNLLRSSNSTSPVTAPSPASEDPEDDHPVISCRVCLKSNTPSKIVCCSICRKGIHTFCLNPPVMDLPNDASWKCIKCRNAHIPLKKEARIILNDALNTYSSLCTDKYVNAVANVVCVVSDSETPDHNKKKNGKTSTKTNRHLEPSNSRNTPNDNTVILRVSTDDSDLDSDVDDDIQPNPVVKPRKPPPTRSSPPTDTNHDAVPHGHPSPPPKKAVAKDVPTPSSPSSLHIDDERPLSQLMSRGAYRRHRQLRSLKSQDIDPAHTSPKMRIKAKQRRMREENPDRLSPSPSDSKVSRDPTNLPPKRRGTKPAAKRVGNDAYDTATQMDVECDNDGTDRIERVTGPVENIDQDVDRRTAPATEPEREEVKRESNEQLTDEPRAPESHTENARAKDTKADISDASTPNIDKEFPGDMEDDLPLSKRSVRYRTLSIPKSSNAGKDKSTADQGEEPASRENPIRDDNSVSNAGNSLREPKVEAVVQEIAGNDTDQLAKAPAPSLPTGVDPHPSTTQQSPETNRVPERKPSDEWAYLQRDPKREALFALARVQRQRPKPGDSCGRLATSHDGEGSGRFSKLMVNRTNNVPESERQRIQVTALAASSMRRNVSNMASTMAGLRPQSPRVSKGSINLLLQQNQTEVRSGITAQRTYAELGGQDTTIPGHETHRDRDCLPPRSSRLHLPDGEGGKFSPGMYPLPANSRRQEGAASKSLRQYGNPGPSGASERYPMRHPQSVAHGGVLSSLEPEAQPFTKHSSDSDILPHAKRHRGNKSDLHNVLSSDNRISVDESRNIRREDPTTRIFSRVDRRILEQSTGRHTAIQGRSSGRPTQAGDTVPPYPYPHRSSQTHYAASAVPANIQRSGITGPDRLSLQQSSVRSISDRNLRTTHEFSGYGGKGLSYGSAASLAEQRRRHSRGEEDRHMAQRPSDNAIRRGLESDLRNTAQVYPSTKPAGEPFSPSLRWNEDRNPGNANMRTDYASASTPNQSWPESRPDHRPAYREFDVPVNRFIPIDRRTRRPMPYVPTATRKAQFEQGRALAFIDSRPAPSNADPSDVFRADDGASRMAPSPYSSRQEGPYSSANEYSYAAGSRSKAAYPNLDSQAATNTFRGDYYRHDYVGGSNEHLVDDRGSYIRESRRDAVQPERVGNAVSGPHGTVFGQSRTTIHRPAQNSSGAPLEPPVEGHKGLSIERMEAPSLGPLMDARVRPRQDKDIPRMTNTLESDRRLPEKRRRLATGSGPGDMAYAASRIGNSSQRSQEIADQSYGSYLSGRNQSESIRPPARTIMDARIPTPLHADPGQYGSRDIRHAQAGRSFAPGIVGASGSRAVFDRPSNQMSNSYSYARSSVLPQSVRTLEEDNEEFGADRVSNIPLVARFDNGYVDNCPPPRSRDTASRTGERSMSQRNEQREQLPSLRSNPSLRDLLS